MADVGRPTDYRPEFVEQAREMAEAAATQIEMADFFGVDVSTFRRWTHHHPEFRAALKLGNFAMCQRVKQSLFNRAVGYEYDAVKIMQDKGAPVIVPYREHVPPDVNAGMFLLKNRDEAETWRDKQDHEHTGPGGGPIKSEQTIDVSKLNADQLRALASIRVPGG